MPVDQTGENILFVMGEGTVEAHVQIQYMGDPQDFAWIVPVMAEPEIEPGSDPLFNALLLGTAPTFVLDTRSEDCGPERPSVIGCGFSPNLAADGGLEGSSDDGFGDGPNVVNTGVAGAFEYAVLEGGTVEGVVQWLDENGYAQDDEAPELLDGYLSKNFLFVAFKLRGGAGIDEIHPVVLRYEGTEPCVPIRLTRIAASEDMGVRAFFLGESRFVSSNYRDVEVNPMAFSWSGGNLGADYERVISAAVDAEGSDGHGFVTEYAGSSTVADPSATLFTEDFALPVWNASRFVGLSPQEAINELAAQRLLECLPGSCTALHPLVPGLLESFLPRVGSATFEEFYGCLNCFDFDATGWSGAEFAAALEERIIGPAEHADDLLAEHSYLTRLYTTISPHEMTIDPLFHANADLPAVSNQISATRVFSCEGPDWLEFEDGSKLALSLDGTTPADMPAALRISEVAAVGGPMEVADYAEESEDARVVWNSEQGLEGDDGCNCRAKKRGAGGIAWTVLMVGLGLMARRRRAR